MSATCSKCANIIQTDQDFGMLACPKCGEVIMVTTVPSASSPQTRSVGPTRSMTEPDFLSPITAKDLAAIPQTRSGPVAFEPTPFSMDSELSVENLGHNVEPSVVVSNMSPISDIESFGNEELPSTGHGALVYDLKISGIDSFPLKKAVIDALDDKRLGLNPTELSLNVKKGILLISNLNPVVAMSLVTKIKFLNLGISWNARQMIKSVFLISLFSIEAFAGQYNRHVINLRGYMGKMNLGQEKIDALINQRKHAHGAKESEKISNEIQKATVELKSFFTEFKLEQDHVRFEHPEGAEDDEVRQYLRFRPKRIYENPSDVDLDGQLTHLKEKVNFQFGKGGTLTPGKSLGVRKSKIKPVEEKKPEGGHGEAPAAPAESGGHH